LIDGEERGDEREGVRERGEEQRTAKMRDKEINSRDEELRVNQ
jgi:hypothetical protein